MPENKYHSEVIGSLLRPDYLKDATAQFTAGQITQDELTAVQDRASLDAIRLQEAVGVDILTDGEMRRRGWTDPLTKSLTGYGRAPALQVNFNAPAGRQVAEPAAESGFAAGSAPVAMSTAVIAKIGRGHNLPLQEMEFVQAHTDRPLKVTLPSLAHASVLWSPGVSDKVYPDREEYLQDVLVYTAGLVAECIARGATYIQMDSPRYTHLVAENGLENFRRLGYDPMQWLDEMIGIENQLVDMFPSVNWGLHLCRGNGPRGAWAVAGGYDPIAEKLFNEIHVDRLLMEYDTPRSGNFEPLRFVPQGKVAVLGLISTKERELETVDLLRERLDDASKYISLDQVSLSPQCGFASAFEGNMDEALQRSKLEVLVQTAKAVWG